MMCLVGVKAYLVQTFFKTVFLVIAFGILHSLVFLPVALSVVVPATERLSALCGRHEK